MKAVKLALYALLLYGGLAQAKAANDAEEGEVLYYMVIPEVFAKVSNMPVRTGAGDADDSNYLKALAEARMEVMIEEMDDKLELITSESKK